MKAIILVDITDDSEITDVLSPFNVDVKLDYWNKVLYLNGIVDGVFDIGKNITDVIGYDR